MTLHYVNAGHNPPLLLQGASSDVMLLKAKGIALGVIDDVELQSVKVDLKPGDVLVLYTDGVTEAFNANDEEFGEDRSLGLSWRTVTARRRTLWSRSLPQSPHLRENGRSMTTSRSWSCGRFSPPPEIPRLPFLSRDNRVLLQPYRSKKPEPL